MRYIAFDIETAPLPDIELTELEPEFTAARNLKDPVKIELDIANKKQAWRDDAALSAITGRVVAIGYATASQEVILDIQDDETEMLRNFWARWDDREWGAGVWAGFNIFNFDLPFLVRRSWKHRIQVPLVRETRWWSSRFVDLRQSWQLGDYQAHGNLDQVCRHLGLGKKTGNGADFAALLKTDHVKAEEYLRNDITLTSRLCEVLIGNS